MSIPCIIASKDCSKQAPAYTDSRAPKARSRLSLLPDFLSQEPNDNKSRYHRRCSIPLRLAFTAPGMHYQVYGTVAGTPDAPQSIFSQTLPLEGALFPPPPTHTPPGACTDPQRLASSVTPSLRRNARGPFSTTPTFFRAKYLKCMGYFLQLVKGASTNHYTLSHPIRR